VRQALLLQFYVYYIIFMVFEVRESVCDGFRVTICVLYHLLHLDIASGIDKLVAAVPGIVDI